MKCNNCGYDITKPNQKKCPCCGVLLTAAATEQTVEPDAPAQEQRLCPKCQTPLPVGVNFCPNCGQDLRQTVEDVQHHVLPESEPEPDSVPVSEPEPIFEPEPEDEPIQEACPEPVYEPEPEPVPKVEPEPTPRPASIRPVSRPRKKRGSSSDNYRSLTYEDNNVEVKKPVDISQEPSTEPVATYDPISHEQVFEYEPEPKQEDSLGYDPYPIPEPSSSNSTSWLLIAACGIVSILLGWLLYIATQS